ncbi:MAG TPA: hypothetical protein VII99_03030 [Bacteroidia bacterium]
MKTIIKKISLSAAAIVWLCTVSFSQEKRGTTIGLSFLKKSDQSKIAIAKVAAKNEQKKFAPTANIPVSFYVLKDKEQVLLGKSISNNEGNAILILPKDVPADADGFFTITGKIDKNNLFEEGEETMHFKNANLTVKLDTKDTGRVVTAIFTETGANGNAKPVKDVAIKFYLQRLFGDLPASDDNSVTTDSKGEASFPFPKDVAGDTTGKIFVVAKVEDNEQYGNLENRTPVQWGTVAPIDTHAFGREMWSPYAPPQIIITLCTLFGGVWCTYFFVLLQLRKMKKEGELQAENENHA